MASVSADAVCLILTDCGAWLMRHITAKIERPDDKGCNVFRQSSNYLSTTMYIDG